MNSNGCSCSIEILIPTESEEKDENKSMNSTANIYSMKVEKLKWKFEKKRTEKARFSLQFHPIRFSTLSFPSFTAMSNQSEDEKENCL